MVTTGVVAPPVPRNRVVAFLRANGALIFQDLDQGEALSAEAKLRPAE